MAIFNSYVKLPEGIFMIHNILCLYLKWASLLRSTLCLDMYNHVYVCKGLQTCNNRGCILTYGGYNHGYKPNHSFKYYKPSMNTELFISINYSDKLVYEFTEL